jgi:hypothetical protein
MGSAASLFYGANDTEKQTLHRRITPSDEQFDEQQDRWNALADHLVADLKQRSEYLIRTWLQGSYKSATQIRPVRMSEEFDIDLGVYFQWEGRPQDGRYSPKMLKGYVQESLKAYAAANTTEVKQVVAPRERCCRIRFKSSFHIDVPTYHLDAARDARHLATESGAWENSDPKAIYLWFRDLFDDLARAKVRRQIKYVKAWAALKFDLNNGRPSSILLSVLVAEAAKALGSSRLGADDETLRDILEKIVERLEGDTEVPNPIDCSENLARMTDSQMATFIERLKTFLDIAERATGKNEELAAADIWQESFEHLFPMPEVTQILVKAASQLPACSFLPDIKVSAVSRTNAVGRFSGVNRIGPIPKNCDIDFEVTNPFSLPPNSELFWMVRNQGREAENINDLGHIAGRGLTAHERSAYRGTHYMDCVVKVADQTVAMQRVPVTITGVAMPRRNPLLRPEWVKLRGRSR